MTTRREFCKKSATFVAGAGVASMVPGAVSCSSNKKIVVGAIGVNGMGMSDLNSLLRIPNVTCVALADVDDNVLKKRAPEVEKVTGVKPDTYKDYKKILERDDIDVVVIGTPDHWHAKIMIEACQAGKDVYVEKPMANTIHEAILMEKAAKKYKRVVQVGQWQRSGPHWQDALEFVQSGKLGKIRMVRVSCYESWLYPPNAVADSEVPAGVDYDMWLGPAPKRPFNKNHFHFQFRWFWDYAGGLMTDWGVHLLDMALAGMQADIPNKIMSGGGKLGLPNSGIETPDTQQVIYEFDDFNMIWEHGMGIGNGPFKRDHAVAFVGHNGTLVVDRGGWEVMPEGSGDNARMEAIPRIKREGNDLDRHTQNFIDAVRRRNRDTNANPTIGKNVAITAHLGNIALRTGKKIYFDRETMNFGNDKESNSYIERPFRAPYTLPKI